MTERRLRQGKALFCSAAVPDQSLCKILIDSFAALVDCAEIQLSNCISLLGTAAEPDRRFDRISLDALPFSIGDSDSVLRSRVALISRQSQPPHRTLMVLGDTRQASEVGEAHDQSGACITRFGECDEL